MARTNDNRYEQSPIPLASLKASDHPARVIGAAARIRTVNPLLTKQPRCRCATAAYVRRSRHPGKMVLARVHRRRNSTAVKRNASERPILKQTPIPNDLFSRIRGPRGGSSHRSQMRFPQPSKAATSSPYGLFPAVPAGSVELAAECSSVRNGRLGNDSADLTFLYTHSAVISSPRICQRVNLFASWSQPRATDIGISAIAILRDGHLGIGGTKGIRTLNFRLAKPALCR